MTDGTISLAGSATEVSAEDAELALVLAALAEKQRESPLEFLELMPSQRACVESDASTVLVLGGNRCLGGECEIYDPVLGYSRRVDSIGGSFHVEAWDGVRRVIAKAERPFKKEVDDLYEINLSNGQTFVASLNHVVLTRKGYQPLGDLSVGDLLFLPQSTLPSGTPTVNNNRLAITNYRLKRRDVKWDFTVPDYHNYILAGVVHHNSGKTTPDAAIVLKAALSKPRMKIWVCGETFQDSIAIQQTKIHQLVPSKEVQYGSFDDINGYTNRKLQFRNGSLVSFKSYDQGRTAFQSDDLDLVICDEEPPLDIIKEIKMRLIDRNGRLVISMTSLKGITDFIRDYFEDCDILETRYAPLVRKTLPVRGRKGSVDIFFLWTTDNKFIDQARLMDEVKLMGESDILARIYGMPINLAGKIYMSFGRDTHVIPLDDAPTTGNQLWHVLDPHDRKPWAMGWYLVNKNETVYCVDEYPNQAFNEMLYDDKTFEEYAKIIFEKEKVLRAVFNCGGRIRRIIDPNFGHKTVQLAQRKGGQSKTTPVKELDRLGLRYKDAIDALEAGHLEVRKWLHWEKKTLSDGRQQFTVAPKFLIADNCVNHINHLMRYSRKDIMAADGDVKDRVSPRQEHKDFCDLTRYLLMANPHWIGEERWEPPKKKVY